MDQATEDHKFYELIHPGGPRGLVTVKPEMREQDAEFEPGEFYMVVFFPRITGIGHATANWPSASETLSKSPEAAIAKFMDRIAKDQKWGTYADAGHRVRKVRIIDLGDAEPPAPRHGEGE